MRSFAFNRDGNVAISAALLMPVMIGMGALAMDASYLYTNKNQLQIATDGAALGAAGALQEIARAKTMAINLANKNVPADYGTVTLSSDVVFGKYDPADATFVPSESEINAVSVVARRKAPTFFGKVFDVDTVDVAAASIAVGYGPNACVIALAPSGQTFTSGGGARVDVPNCNIWVNSSDENALHQNGSGSIAAAAIGVVGGYKAGGNFSPLPNRDQRPVADPLLGVPEPSAPSSCTYTNQTFSTPITIKGGSVLCGSISFASHILFSDGVIYFKDADVTTTADAQLTSTNAMIFLDGKSTWDSSGTGYVQLSAPETGPYAGIAMFSARSASVTTFKLTGGKDYFVKGTLYLPKVNLQFFGNSELSVSSKNGYVIAWSMKFQGAARFVFDSWGGSVPSGLGTGASLVY
ncbi:hypothetical protein ABID21_004911 [Pseudorhizobium tarimense]|uniref:Flp pilus-assembly TadG-like N-terminal domain-containing protein n=1 Tax=Pseudorhizobium tarimense TaxID=1079109 RepID=A0ABV2HEV6_9HYPH|nr:pilus assembly protein TadG-related protein [Pseudorhizobium tarimense]MCJ8521731.1 pilus assembly protein TadG-related protein [Pseudorhizobium tarimense]